MKIYNTTTGETVDLSYYDRRINQAQQQDSAIDLCGSDPDIIYNQDEDRYEANQDCIDYWQAWFNAMEHCDGLERDIRQELKELNENDISGRIHDEVDQHYFEEESWPVHRYKLLMQLRREIDCEMMNKEIEQKEEQE